MGEDEEGTLRNLKAHRSTLLDPSVAEHRERIVKTSGDGLLAEFQSAVDAVRCAVEIQRGMAERNAAAPARTVIKTRRFTRSPRRLPTRQCPLDRKDHDWPWAGVRNFTGRAGGARHPLEAKVFASASHAAKEERQFEQKSGHTSPARTKKVGAYDGAAIGRSLAARRCEIQRGFYFNA